MLPKQLPSFQRPPASHSTTTLLLRAALPLQLLSDTHTHTPPPPPPPPPHFIFSLVSQPPQPPSISRPPPDKSPSPSCALHDRDLDPLRHTYPSTTCLNSHAPPAHRTAFRLSAVTIPILWLGAPISSTHPKRTPTTFRSHPTQTSTYHSPPPCPAPPLHLHVFLRKPPKV